jgi:hypothetical protein
MEMEMSPQMEMESISYGSLLEELLGEPISPEYPAIQELIMELDSSFDPFMGAQDMVPTSEELRGSLTINHGEQYLEYEEEEEEYEEEEEEEEEEVEDLLTLEDIEEILALVHREMRQGFFE